MSDSTEEPQEPLAADLPPAAEHELIAQNASDSGGATDGGRDDERPASYKPGQDGSPLSVVGIGASAGGVQVLQELFGGMADDTGLAFVVVIHLDPEHESTLAEILQTKTSMPVIQVKEEVRVEPNRVYVIPPSKHLTMRDSKLQLVAPQQAKGKRVAVDLFFRTLAEQYGQKCACIILSGTDSDGVIGLKHVKAQGGVTIAQDPGEAEFDSMPRNAIETGMVDWILPVSEMPKRLQRFAKNEQAMTLPPEGNGEISAESLPDIAPRGPGGPLISKQTDDPTDERALHAVLAFVRSQTGHDFMHYKRATVLRRIARRLQVNGLEDVPAYLDFLHTHPAEARALLNDLLIGVTHFFRDQSAFRALEAHIPQLFTAKRPNEQLRVWVAGCATGEEAYSIGMLLCEQAARVENPPQIQIFATDLDEESIRTAREGIYPPTIEVDVSQERLRRFFFNHHGRYRVKKELRELVLFAEHDILRDSPFSRLDLVSCRNLLIYLKPEAQHRVLDIFHFALKAGGVLFLGGSENVHESHLLFSSIDRRNHIYVRRSTPRGKMLTMLPSARMPQAKPDPVLPRLASPAVEAEFTPGSESISRLQGRVHSLGQLHVAMLEQYAPPSVIVDQNHEILHMSPGAGEYLRFSGGEPSTNILKLAGDSLRIELRTALFRAAQEGDSVTAPRVRILRDGEERFINLHVRPAQTSGTAEERIFLVVFEEVQLSEAQRAAAAPAPLDHDGVTRHLEEELRQVRAQLSATVEQYETANEELKASNEELQAMNEEMRSAGEELETSKEELQSINEELTTVNHELKSNIEELGRTNSDLNNLIASTDIATLFLDRRLCIKRFTPRAAELFNVIANDIGRPLSDITRKLNYPELNDDATRVLNDLVKVRREVQADGHWFLARLSPYRTVEEKIDGVVMAFVEITDRKRAEEKVRASEQRLLRMVNVPQVGVLTFKYDGRLLHANDAFIAMLGYTRAEFEARSWTWRDFTPAQHLETGTRFLAEVAQTGRGGPYEKEYLAKDGTLIWMMFVAADLGDGTFVKYAVDISDRKYAEQALVKSEEQFRRAIQEAPIPVIMHAEDGTVLQVSRTWSELTGYSVEDVPTFDAWLTHAYGEGADEVRAHMQRLFEGDDRSIGVEFPIRTRHGETRHWSFSASSPGTLRDGRRFIIGMAVDVTEGIRAQAASHESEQRLRTLIENLPGGAIFIVDRDLRYQLATGEALVEAGFAEGELVGRTIFEVLPPELAAAYEPKYRQALAGETFQHEHEAHGRYFSSRGVPLRGSEGEPVAVLAISYDITDRKRVEEALRVSEERFRQFAENSADVFWILDARTEQLEYINPVYEKMFGQPRQTLMRDRKARLELVVPEDRVQAARGLEQALEGETFVRNYRIVRPTDGSTRWIRDTGFPIRDETGKITRIAGVAQDVTQDKDRSRALESVEERFRLLVEGTPDYAMFLLDATNKITFWSAGAEKVFGWTAQEAVGQDGHIIFIAEDRAKGEVEKELNTAMKYGRAPDRRWHKRKDGTRLWADGIMRRVDTKDGTIRGFAKICRDATDQKTIEEALRHAKDEMEQRVLERTRDLVAMNNELERTMAQRQQLEKELLEISEREKRRIGEDLHDMICQELTATALFLKSGAKRVEKESSAAAETLEESAQIVNRNVGLARDMARGLQPADLQGRGLRQALKGLAEQACEGSEIKCHFRAARGVRVTDDTTALHIYRVAQEAVKNAVKHSGAQNVLITLDRDDTNEHVCVSVEDDGKGFSLAKRSKGLGLHIMRYRANALGGELKIEKRKNGGTEVRCKIPLKHRAA